MQGYLMAKELRTLSNHCLDMAIFDTDIYDLDEERELKPGEEANDDSVVIEPKASNKRAIVQEAFNQKFIDLREPISDVHARELIKLLTRSNTNKIQAHYNYINNRFSSLLRPLIPRYLITCWYKYPQSIRPAPGFLYRIDKRYGDNITFWVVPKVPYFIEQGKELEILVENNGTGFLGLIDERILRFYQEIESRSEREEFIVSTIINNNIVTYYDLLKVKPAWYKILYDYVINTYYELK